MVFGAFGGPDPPIELMPCSFVKSRRVRRRLPDQGKAESRFVPTALWLAQVRRAVFTRGGEDGSTLIGRVEKHPPCVGSHTGVILFTSISRSQSGA